MEITLERHIFLVRVLLIGQSHAYYNQLKVQKVKEYISDDNGKFIKNTLKTRGDTFNSFNYNIS